MQGTFWRIWYTDVLNKYYLYDHILSVCIHFHIISTYSEEFQNPITAPTPLLRSLKRTWRSQGKSTGCFWSLKGAWKQWVCAWERSTSYLQKSCYPVNISSFAIVNRIYIFNKLCPLKTKSETGFNLFGIWSKKILEE